MALTTREVITIGPVMTLTQNTVVATPARYCKYFVTPAASTVEGSNDGTTWVTQTVSAQGEFETKAALIRLTSAGPALVRAVAA